MLLAWNQVPLQAPLERPGLVRHENLKGQKKKHLQWKAMVVFCSSFFSASHGFRFYTWWFADNVTQVLLDFFEFCVMFGPRKWMWQKLVATRPVFKKKTGCPTWDFFIFFPQKIVGGVNILDTKIKAWNLSGRCSTANLLLKLSSRMLNKNSTAQL